ncbi:DUF4352 domain-containing protein [Staphylococcus equorum]|uniref:DUF4352 domain-containing protein n=1 Tax=Staphylococcus equorum TaxID=246432 RepID=A0A9X4LG24_9STAP|nr:DUF4352 domain-containing protein [Staphylococcus equorum]MDG0843789.1 DUF4352 domain-containing protein [Staphylococcus equorum]MDG0860080.1 DUF4352 domain-containing protein [Staphylococcus equorum]
MKKLLFLALIALLVLAACGTENDKVKSKDKESDKTEENSNAKATGKMKNFKIGQVVHADGVDIKLTKVEYVNEYDEYSAPENGRVVKVHLKFKNNNNDQVLVDSADFSMKMNNENYQEWFGNDDTNAGFSHQLNKGNTGSGYITYDVPEGNEYALEMDAHPKFENIKARWKIKKEDIKEATGQSENQTSENIVTETEPESESAPEETDGESTEEDEDTESEEMTYPAEMYNSLVDEYNELTDGEKMNHVEDDVLEIEYDQLEARVDELYNKQMELEDQEYEEQMKQDEKEFDEEMKRQDEAYEQEMKEQDEAYEKEMEEIDKAYEEDMKAIEDDESTE